MPARMSDTRPLTVVTNPLQSNGRRLCQCYEDGVLIVETGDISNLTPLPRGDCGLPQLLDEQQLWANACQA